MTQRKLLLQHLRSDIIVAKMYKFVHLLKRYILRKKWPTSGSRTPTQIEKIWYKQSETWPYDEGYHESANYLASDVTVWELRGARSTENEVQYVTQTTDEPMLSLHTVQDSTDSAVPVNISASLIALT